MNADKSIPPQASDPNHKHVIASGARQSQIINRKSKGSGVQTLRTHPPPVQHPNNVAFTADVLRRRVMGRTPLEDGP